jgi:hypothetical protein
VGGYAVTVESNSGRALAAHAIILTMQDQAITPAFLASAADIPLHTLRQRLAAQSPFTLDELQRIAGVLGTRPSSLLE